MSTKRWLCPCWSRSVAVWASATVDPAMLHLTVPVVAAEAVTMVALRRLAVSIIYQATVRLLFFLLSTLLLH